MLKYRAARKVHRLINKERHKRGLRHIYWSKEMYRFAKEQASYCAKVGRLVHSNRFAFEGGENLCGGKGNFSPETIVKTWMKSKAGHRENLLSPRARKAAVAIATSKHGTYAAWSFSAQAPDPHDCPYYKTPHPKSKIPFKPKGKAKGGDEGMRTKWQWVEDVARIVELIFALILASWAFSQMMKAHTGIWLQIAFCIFVVALVVVRSRDGYRVYSARRRRAARR